MQNILFIATGGVLGALLRFFMYEIIIKNAGVNFPWGIVIINLIGCFAIGIVWSLFQVFDFDNNIRLFIFVGLLGSFTTFSTFALENFNYFRNSEFYIMAANILISNIAGILLVFAGAYITKAFLTLLNK